MKMTYGLELELGDVDRRREIPPELGAWEYAECDVVNAHPPYRGVASDPLGIDPPMGGEINIRPTTTTSALVYNTMDTIEWFRKQGDNPTAPPTSHVHVHIRTIGLRDDIAALKRVVRYVYENQEDLLAATYAFEETDEMRETKTAIRYLRWDGGNRIKEWMVENIENLAHDFDSFIRMHHTGKDGVRMGRVIPGRLAVNTYAMRFIDTIEFRCFRSTLCADEFYSCIEASQQFLKAAIEGGPPFKEILEANPVWQFPKLKYDHELWLGYEKTMWPKNRGKKKRTFIDV